MTSTRAFRAAAVDLKRAIEVLFVRPRRLLEAPHDARIQYVFNLFIMETPPAQRPDGEAQGISLCVRDKGGIRILCVRFA
jgi:hypothetical protein